jgi:hypothetical protein
MSEAKSGPAPVPGEATLPVDHPARADDRDRGKVALGYEGYRMPFWVIIPWLCFIMYAVTYLVLYLLPDGRAARP